MIGTGLRAVVVVLVGLAGTLAAASSHAMVIAYTDRSSFEAAVLDLSTYDFNTATDNQVLDAGVDFGAFTISQPTSGAHAYIRSGATAGNTDGTKFVSFEENSSGSNVPLVVAFDSAVRAFGFDYNNISTSPNFNISTTILGSPYLVATHGASGFFGFVSTDATMTQATFDLLDSGGSSSSGHLGVDNFSWGSQISSQTSVDMPEPAALPAMLAGLAALGFVRRRRRGAQACRR